VIYTEKQIEEKPSRSVEEINSTCDMAGDILQRTNDGNDLEPMHLKLIEDAVNGFLNEKGIEYLKEIHRTVVEGKYKKPPFHGIENLSIDHVGYVYWKGHKIEHYDLPWAYSEEAHKSALELERRCKILESRGIVLSVNSVIWRWEEKDDEQPVLQEV
jgi:hypothetical protein